MKNENDEGFLGHLDDTGKKLSCKSHGIETNRAPNALIFNRGLSFSGMKYIHPALFYFPPCTKISAELIIKTLLYVHEIRKKSEKVGVCACVGMYMHVCVPPFS